LTTHLRVTHNDTTQSVGLLWMSDQPVAETSTWQTHNTHNRQTSMSPVGFEPAIPAGDRLQTHALDRSATGIGTVALISHKNSKAVAFSQYFHNFNVFIYIFMLHLSEGRACGDSETSDIIMLFLFHTPTKLISPPPPLHFSISSTLLYVALHCLLRTASNRLLSLFLFSMLMVAVYVLLIICFVTNCLVRGAIKQRVHSCDRLSLFERSIQQCVTPFKVITKHLHCWATIPYGQRFAVQQMYFSIYGLLNGAISKAEWSGVLENASNLCHEKDPRN
jgi:hypothetical protein